MKRHGSIALIFGMLVLACGCAKRMAAPPPPPPPPETILGSESNGSQESLFKGDQAVLSDQDIGRILNTRLSLADRHRMAILSLGSNRWWSEDLADIEAKNFDAMLQAFKAAPQLTDARLPTLACCRRCWSQRSEQFRFLENLQPVFKPTSFSCIRLASRRSTGPAS